jgi:hypothetical protein
MTNRLVMLIVSAIAVLLLAAPAGAYLLTLSNWNEAALQVAGDTVTVNVSGKTITFTWNDGNSLSPAAANLTKLFWTQAVATAGGGTVANPGGGDPTSTTPVTYSYSVGNGMDGFNSGHGYPTYVRDADATSGSATAVTLTFANAASNLPVFTANDFVVTVAYGSGCSGMVGGPGSGSGPGFMSPGNAGCTAATPVPEPITMFLGGTGLLALGYAARKRLFGGQVANAR